MSQALVAEIKQGLVAAGVNLSGPCGAFNITKRVAWALRHTGIGLHRQDRGRTGCEDKGGFYSTDFLVFRDGRAVDMLGDAGGANTPQWGEEVGDPLRWVAPYCDWQETPVETGTIPIDSELANRLLSRLDNIEAALGGVLSSMQAFNTNLGRIESNQQNTVYRGRAGFLGTVTLEPLLKVD